MSQINRSLSISRVHGLYFYTREKLPADMNL